MWLTHLTIQWTVNQVIGSGFDHQAQLSILDRVQQFTSRS